MSSFLDLPDDLILEIIIKLKYNNLKILLSDKKMVNVYKYNIVYITKKIINTYLFVYTKNSDIQVLTRFGIDFNNDDTAKVSQIFKLNALDFLIKNNISKYNINEELLWAVQSGCLDIVKYFISYNGKGIDLHYRDDYAITVAAEAGHLDIILFLIEEGIDPRTSNDLALCLSASSGHLNIVKYFISLGLNPHTYNDSALESAAINGHIETVQLLIDSKFEMHTYQRILLMYIEQQCKHINILGLIKML